jgi:membrane-bound metal-dependent hydrolase YbcI (DUF457 family)
MSRLPGGGAGGIFRDGPGKGVVERLIETPYLAWAFLLALVAFFLFFLLDHRKFKHPVPITLLVASVVVYFDRNAEGHGWEYALIWIVGSIGCIVYWLDRLIREGITRY